MVSLVKALPRQPAHPPLAGAGIGAYTAGVAMLVAGAAAFRPTAMATSVITTGIGLIAAIPTIVTGLVDLFGIPLMRRAHPGLVARDADVQRHRHVRRHVPIAVGWILRRQDHARR